ncbi:MAG: response regulator [Verrucomicrobiota bacterium]
MKRILIVEDNPDNLDMLTRRLERKDFEVVSATDGKSGLEMAQTKSPDLILLDIDLPEMDGWEVSRFLKKDERTREIPVIALTAFALEGDREKALEVGCDGYASKPIGFRDLLEKMATFLPH